MDNMDTFRCVLKYIALVGGVLICIFVSAVIVHVADIIPVRSNGYPYAKKEIFVKELDSENVGNPYYININSIICYASDKMIAYTEYGELFLYRDYDNDFGQGVLSDYGDMIEVFFVYSGWDESLNIPCGIFLGVRDEENNGTDLPAYSEAYRYYTEKLVCNSYGKEITPLPLPT